MSEKRPVATSGGAGADAANGASAPAMSEDAVIDYLVRHPDVLARHPRLLETQSLPSRTNGNVVDMQHVLMQRLRDENGKLREAYDAVVGTARYNRSAQTQVHAGVLQILSADSFENLIRTVTADLPLVLNVDAVTICLETDDMPIPRAFAAGLRSLPAGTVDRLLDPDRDIVLVSPITGDSEIFGPAAGLIRSQALARLRVSDHAPKGMLALGARDVEAFHQSHGTELVSFLTRTLEVTIRRWLALAT